jgi:hypothetical protein
VDSLIQRWPASFENGGKGVILNDETTIVVDRSDEIGRIRQVVEAWVGAFHDKDVEAALSLHANSIVSFDKVDPDKEGASG